MLNSSNDNVNTEHTHTLFIDYTTFRNATAIDDTTYHRAITIHYTAYLRPMVIDDTTHYNAYAHQLHDVSPSHGHR